MRRKKVPHPLREAGYKQVPDCSGKIVDSIWRKDNELIIRFAWGPQLRFAPIEDV